MSIDLTVEQKEEVQRKYQHLINYQDDDVLAPIDPLTYVDSNGDTLLHIAASLGDCETVELLLNAGLSVDQLGDLDNTALHYARSGGHDEVVELLEKHGARTDMENVFGRVP